MMNKKSLKSLKNDKRAVSPVIGVILMVAITVILAAVIGAFVFGVGPPEQTPILQIQATPGALADYIVLSHSGGDTVVWTDLRIHTSEDAGVSDPWAGVNVITPPEGLYFAPGDTATIESTSSEAAGNTTVIRILHETSGGLLLKTSVITGTG